MYVEGVKGECNNGQHEIVFKYADALTACDDHVVYKTGAKEIAAQEGMALTYMAKYDQREGNSCHIHLSVRSDDGGLVMADDADPDGLSPLGRSFIAGQIAHMRDMSLLFAPNINSYKRFVEGSFAPTAIKWGRDNRTSHCAWWATGIPAPGESRTRRGRQPVPGGSRDDRRRA